MHGRQYQRGGFRWRAVPASRSSSSGSGEQMQRSGGPDNVHAVAETINHPSPFHDACAVDLRHQSNRTDTRTFGLPRRRVLQAPYYPPVSSRVHLPCHRPHPHTLVRATNTRPSTKGDFDAVPTWTCYVVAGKTKPCHWTVIKKLFMASTTKTSSCRK